MAGVGGALALNGTLDLGSLVASLGLAQFLIGPLQVLAGAVSEVGRGLASAERVRTVLARPPAVAETDGLQPLPPGDIVLQAVPVAGLGPVDLTLAEGRLTGLVLSDAVAAFHLCRLLGRELDPTAGRITVGGTALQDVSLDQLRRVVLVAPHESRLFAGTMADNVTTGGAGEASSAMTAAMADEVLATLPHGSGTDLGADGHRLSGGQRQRVALAHALAAAAPVLVLHDPTTAVDAATEAAIAERVALARRGLTTVLVTTSPALLRRCDRVVFLRPGNVRSGTHQEFQDRIPDYRGLVHR